MNQEIERKFLVNHAEWNRTVKPQGKTIIQSYLSTNPEKTIRVRVYGEKGFITVKGKAKGLTRPEFEYEIPLKDAKEMINLFSEVSIEKKRYEIKLDNHIWEVDVFEGNNTGLIIAEIELNSENENFNTPNWITEEVSNDVKYFNSNLQKNPFCNW
jgi:adenylate cyclase